MVVERKGKVLVRRRALGAINGGFWEFPCQELTASSSDHRTLTCLFPWAAKESCRLVAEVRHSITQYRFVSRAYYVPGAPASAARQTRAVWRSWRELDAMAMVSAHRKILHRLRADARR